MRNNQLGQQRVFFGLIRSYASLPFYIILQYKSDGGRCFLGLGLLDRQTCVWLLGEGLLSAFWCGLGFGALMWLCFQPFQFVFASWDDLAFGVFGFGGQGRWQCLCVCVCVWCVCPPAVSTLLILSLGTDPARACLLLNPQPSVAEDGL